MKYLVFCRCSHNLEAHGPEGCVGERGQVCTCRLDQFDALNAAIDSARDNAVALWRKQDDAEGVESA